MAWPAMEPVRNKRRKPMIKLTYSKPGDEFDCVTVIGSAAGIFDLWFRLTHANPEYPTHGVENIRMTNLDGYPIDPTKGIHQAYQADSDLGRSLNA
jgi:hypothetical protein